MLKFLNKLLNVGLRIYENWARNKAIQDPASSIANSTDNDDDRVQQSELSFSELANKSKRDQVK